MDELERYHQEETGRFTASGDWSSLVRHFIRYGGYQPAMDEAIHVLQMGGAPPCLETRSSP